MQPEWHGRLTCTLTTFKEGALDPRFPAAFIVSYCHDLTKKLEMGSQCRVRYPHVDFHVACLLHISLLRYLLGDVPVMPVMLSSDHGISHIWLAVLSSTSIPECSCFRLAFATFLCDRLTYWQDFTDEGTGNLFMAQLRDLESPQCSWGHLPTLHHTTCLHTFTFQKQVYFTIFYLFYFVVLGSNMGLFVID